MYRDLKLSDRARVIEMAVRSGITDLDTIEKVYNTFAEGGDLGNNDSEDRETIERRKVGEHYLTLEQYKELQRDTIRQAAIQKALTRTRGIAPIINGEPGSSCIYTFTDNYGRKYQVAGTQTFAANPEKYGFEVAGPVTEGMEGNMYLQLDKRGVPYHATMITGYTDKGEPLLTYSRGHAGGATPISRERWDSDNQTGQTYEQYLELFNRYSSPEADYKKNQPVWSSPSYETYRFIGTPDDNALWEQQFNKFQHAPTPIDVPKTLNNRVVQNAYAKGGHLKSTGGPEGDKETNLANFEYNPQSNALPDELFKGVPYKPGYHVKLKSGEIVIPGLRNIDANIRNGHPEMYELWGDPRLKYLKNKDTGEYFEYVPRVNPDLDLSKYDEVTLDEIKKALPKRDYIGGDGYRLRAAQRIPGFIEEVGKRAKAYGLDPNVLLHRIMQEGYIDQMVKGYNNTSVANQKNYFTDPRVWTDPINGYGSFGLDYVGDELMKGLYTLKDPNATWTDAGEREDFEGGVHRIMHHSPQPDNLRSAIEMMAASMAYRQQQAIKMYPDAKNNPGLYVNASYNMGLSNSKMKDPELVRRKYAYPNYGVFGAGGLIHIKPENRGKFTALKERTGHSASWFKEHGTPSQKKMATFALNARKWKHSNGGLMTKL